MEEMGRVAFGAVVIAVLCVCSPGGRVHGQSTNGTDPLRRDVFVVLRDPGPVRRGDLIARRRLVAGQQARVLGRAGRSAVRVRRPLRLAGAFTASVTAAGLARLRADPEVAAVDPIAYGRAALADTVPLIRADAVHARDSVGSGVTVAVLDGGIDPTHPDLAGSIVAEECFCSNACCPNGGSRQSGTGAAVTTDTHGPHVAGILVSKGIVAPVGVAPGARIVAVKVLAPDLTGMLADWVAALEWIAESRPDVQVVNMSLATTALYAGACDDADASTRAFARIINLLRERGVLVLAASGNVGQSGALTAPACVAGAIAVGATTKFDGVAAFSNSDSTLDLLAPGSSIVSVGPAGGTRVMSGTSASTPHATATAALLLDRNPSVMADALEAALESSDVHIEDRRNRLVRPRLNAFAATTAVDRITVPLLGGGSRRTDCLVTWRLPPSSAGTAHTAPGTVCRDNDAACDSDPTPGQCAFAITACFNTPDRRVPYCASEEPIVAARLTWPDPAQSSDPADRGNAAAVAAALPALPITGAQCSAPLSFVVPVGSSGGSRWLRLSAQTAPGGVEGARDDRDGLRFRCLPAS